MATTKTKAAAAAEAAALEAQTPDPATPQATTQIQSGEQPPIVFVDAEKFYAPMNRDVILCGVRLVKGRNRCTPDELARLKAEHPDFFASGFLSELRG